MEKYLSKLRADYDNADQVLDAQLNNITYLFSKGFKDSGIGYDKATERIISRLFLNLRTEDETITFRLEAKGEVSGKLSSGMQLSNEHIPELETILQTKITERGKIAARMEASIANSGASLKRNPPDKRINESMSGYMIVANGISAEEVHSTLMKAYNTIKEEFKPLSVAEFTERLPPGIIINKASGQS